MLYKWKGSSQSGQAAGGAWSLSEGQRGAPEGRALLCPRALSWVDRVTPYGDRGQAGWSEGHQMAARPSPIQPRGLSKAKSRGGCFVGGVPQPHDQSPRVCWGQVGAGQEDRRRAVGAGLGLAGQGLLFPGRSAPGGLRALVVVPRQAWSPPAQWSVVWTQPGVGTGRPGPKAGSVMTPCDPGPGLTPRGQPGSP